jgi:hypothetical protein
MFTDLRESNQKALDDRDSTKINDVCARSGRVTHPDELLSLAEHDDAPSCPTQEFADALHGLLLSATGRGLYSGVSRTIAHLGHVAKIECGRVQGHSPINL